MGRKKIQGRIVNFRKTKDEGIMNAIWDNFHVKGITKGESITRKQIEKN